MKNNIDAFKKSWFEYAAIFFLTTSLLFVYLSPYWSFEDSSRSASLIRIMLFLTSLFLIPYALLKNIKIGDQLIKAGPVNVLLSVLFLYLFVSAFFVSEDYQPARRLLVLVFLFLPSHPIFVFIGCCFKNFRLFPPTINYILSTLSYQR